MMKRRSFLHASTALSAGSLFSLSRISAQDSDILEMSKTLVPTRAITSGPAFHWFGYYDKLQFDPTNRLVLTNQVHFEGRTPTAEDQIRVGFVDLEDKDRWTEIGTSKAWGWQQGCMLQWLPGSKSKVVWNDREKDRFVCRIHDIESGETTTVPRPIYSLSPDGKWAVTADFARIQNLRPGYGYQGVDDPVRAVKSPEESGIWRVNLENG
ncbi:MAG: hypothetical protein AAGC68_12045, partial [Verrucomicrobiota bacterium]